jgi:hypothetical protein
MRENMTVIISLLILFICAGSFTACSDSHKKEQQPPSVVQEQVPTVDEATRQAFKSKLDALGIPVYKGAAFVDIKRKSKDSPLLYAVYDAAVSGGKTYEDVRSFYAGSLKKVLGAKGWTVNRSRDNVILYRKGFEIFYVELVKVITPPAGEKVRIELHYGS